MKRESEEADVGLSVAKPKHLSHSPAFQRPRFEAPAVASETLSTVRAFLSEASLCPSKSQPPAGTPRKHACNHWPPASPRWIPVSPTPRVVAQEEEEEEERIGSWPQSRGAQRALPLGALRHPAAPSLLTCFPTAASCSRAKQQVCTYRLVVSASMLAVLPPPIADCRW